MIDFNNILNANDVLAGVIRETPVLFSEAVNDELGVNLYLKAECNQINGSFKSRGAYFAMHQYFQKNEKKDVVAFSSGNHAQGVAYSANLMGVKATIVMPEDTPKTKIQKTESLGAKVIFYDRYNESRQAIAKKLNSRRLLLMTNVEGVLDKDKKLIEEISSSEILEMVKNETITGGMIPKINTCLDAVNNGVTGVVIVDGRRPHSILFELFSDKGAGTLISCLLYTSDAADE